MFDRRRRGRSVGDVKTSGSLIGSSYSGGHNCLIKSNGSKRKCNLWPITEPPSLRRRPVGRRRKWLGRHLSSAPRPGRRRPPFIPVLAASSSFIPPLSFKKVSTTIAFTRYLLIVTALLRRHKSAVYDRLSGHDGARGIPPADYCLR